MADNAAAIADQSVSKPVPAAKPGLDSGSGCGARGSGRDFRGAVLRSCVRVEATRSGSALVSGGRPTCRLAKDFQAYSCCCCSFRSLS
jgi:hypothetical protein